VSETNARSIDPRFDPRFQRGYVPDASAPPAAESDAVRPAPTAPTAPAVPTAPSPAPAAAAPAPAIADAPLPATPEPIRSEPIAEVVRERPSATPETDPEPVFAALTDPDDDSSGIAPWFIAGWGVSVVAVILGISLWWASITSRSYYGGPSNESDRWLQAFGWMVAPTLIEVGILSVVVMLVWAGIRHARRTEEPR
jgi:hypothetical protein